MADFVLLYSGGSMPETEAEQARVMQAWTDWYGKLGAAVKDGGNPFSPEVRAIANDGAMSSSVGTPHTGYTILTADSLDEAATLAKDSPVLQGGGGIEIYEIVEVM
jgi:hypothetical protein